MRIGKLVFFLMIFLSPAKLLFPQETEDKTANFRLWSLLEPEPSLEYKPQEGEKPFQYALNGIKELAPFLATGLAYGWEFSFTPSDAVRKVEEFFQLIPIQNYPSEGIKYSEPNIEDGKFTCMVSVKMPDGFAERKKIWESIAYQKLYGTGSGPFIKGAEGIRVACEEAVKNAVKETLRGVLKNKPKEITGSVILQSSPIIHVENGQYVVNGEFFFRLASVVPYTVF